MGQHPMPEFIGRLTDGREVEFYAYYQPSAEWARRRGVTDRGYIWNGDWTAISTPDLATMISYAETLCGAAKDRAPQ